MEGGRVRLMSLLRDYGPFADISARYVQEKVAHLVIIPKICLKHPWEEYTEMGMTALEQHNFHIVKTTSALTDTQPFTVS